MHFEISQKYFVTKNLILTLLLLFAAVAEADDYQLGPSDLLHISVFDHPELTLDTRITQSGNISYPLIGVVAVGGLSTHEAEQLIAHRLTEGAFIKQPQVSIVINEYQSQKVGVVGQVSKPGQYSLMGSQRVLDVLTQAGGILNDSASDQATLVHKDGTTKQIDLRKLFDGDMSMNVNVHDGDTLSVPKAPQFYIYGQVQHPGAYKLTNNMTVSQAISTGGGLTSRGTERRSVVKRHDSKGKEHEVHLKSSEYLQPDDVLLVKESLF